MFDLTVENTQGKKLKLMNSADYAITQISGLNPPSATINNSVVGLNDGAKYNSSRVEVRNLVLTVNIKRYIESNRIKLYNYFKTKQWIKIYYKNKARKVYVEGYVESIECDLFTVNETMQISIICPQPYFKAVDDMIFDISQVLSLFEFPFSIENDGIEFSTYDKTLTASVVNAGDVETGVIIELSATGEVKNPVIYNAGTREFFKLEITMKTGDLIKINTNKGSKSIELTRNGVKQNIINSVGFGSSWFQLDVGDNLFTYDTTDGNEYFYMKFYVSNCYEGV